MRAFAYILFVIAAISILCLGCTDSTTDKPVGEVDTVLTDTLAKELQKDTLKPAVIDTKVFALSAKDKEYLALLTQLDMGFSYRQVKAKCASVKGIRPEEKKDDLATKGLTESVCKLPMFEAEASAEFNFKDDSLYSYYFTYNEVNSEKAELVFQALKKHYSAQWGEAMPERVEEENHYSQNFMWPSQNYFVPYLNYNLNTNTIVWGRRYEKSL